jgi:sec-independent protein translocase protein TatB
MNFFGLGLGEIFLILLIVLVVVGPERLPMLARQTGLMIARVQSWIQRSPDAMMIMQARQELQREIENLRVELVEMQQAQQRLVESAQQAIQTPLDELKAVGEELKSIPTTASDSGGKPPAQAPAPEQPVAAEHNGFAEAPTPPADAQPAAEAAAPPLDSDPSALVDEALPETALDWSEFGPPPEPARQKPPGDERPALLEPSLPAPDTEADASLLAALDDASQRAHEIALEARLDELSLRLQTLAAELAALRTELASRGEQEVTPITARNGD